MCLAQPARIVEVIDPQTVIVELDGVRQQISIALVPEAHHGGYVLVHMGKAIGVLDETEALATLALFAELIKDCPPRAQPHSLP